MSSATETAIKGLITALTAQSAIAPSAFPVPSRNSTLPTKFTASIASFSDVTCFFNVNDGNGKPEEETLGAPDNVPDTYEIHHRVEIEWVVQGGSSDDREAAFDAGLIAINKALSLNGTDTTRSLGGAVNWCQIDETIRSNLVTDALPNTKGIVVYVLLVFLSSLPF